MINFAELMLIICCALGVVVLIIVSIDEPKYTWRQVATFDERMAYLQDVIDGWAQAICDRLIPVFRDAVLSFDEASKAFEKFSDILGKQ